MSTEDTDDVEGRARALLAKAAATIEVDDAAPITLTGLPEPGQRRWPVFAAAAAVVLAIGGGLVVTRQLGSGGLDSGPPPADGPTTARPVEEEHVFADDEMPSLLGYTRAEAVELLGARGYEVRVREERSCDQPAGYVLSTDPGPGTVMATGDAVRLRVTGGPAPNVRCAVATDTWQQVLDLARFARGLGPAPRFPAEVGVAVGEGAPVGLTAEDAADPASWVICADGECHSPLAALAQILTGPVGLDDHFVGTYLEVTDDLFSAPDQPGSGCLTGDPYEQGSRYHSPTYVYVDYPMDGPRICPPPPVLQIDWTEDRRIAGVRLRLPVGTQPSEEPAEVTAEQQAAADAFVAWARGDGPAPAFAARVRSFLPGFSPPWNAAPESRETWGGCSGLGFPDCPINPVGTIARYDGTVAVAAGPATCPAGGAVPRRFPGADVVRLEEPEPASCEESWAVELWVDGAGAIYAVRQVGVLPG